MGDYKLPSGSIISYQDVQAIVLEDDGGESIKVWSEGSLQTWKKVFQEIYCVVISIPYSPKVGDILNPTTGDMSDRGPIIVKEKIKFDDPEKTGAFDVWKVQVKGIGGYMNASILQLLS